MYDYDCWITTSNAYDWIKDRCSLSKTTTSATETATSVSICTVSPLDIDRVIFNEPATIVLWRDGTKTVVKAVNEEYDPEKGLAIAICKKVYGNKGNYFEVLKKHLKKYEPKYVEVPMSDAEGLTWL